MKKLFFGILAMAAFAACSNEEPVASLQGDAIAFGDAFVDNATKVIYDNDNPVTEIQVWGNVKQSGTTNTPVALYGKTGATVSGGAYGTIWNCSVVRYWTPLCDFNFLAIAHGTVAEGDVVNGIPTKISYNVLTDGNDLLLSTPVVAKTDASGAPTEGVETIGEGAAAKKVVAFTMNHLLSRVKVSFENALAEATDYQCVICGVKAVAAGSGTYTIAGEGTWATGADVDIVYQAGEVILAANATTDYAAQLLIPTSPVDLEFTYKLQFQESAGTWKTISSGTIKKEDILTPVKNHSYHITVQLKAGAQIDFTVDTLTGWGDYSSTIQ